MAHQSEREQANRRRGIEKFPEELSEFFAGNQGRVLLVRGDPGVGKTLFAVTALDVLRQHGGDVLYVSTRVDTDTVYENYLAGKTGLMRSNVLDVSQGPFDTDITPAEELGTDSDRFDPESFLEWLEAVGEVSKPLTVAFDSWELVGRYLRSHAPRDEAADPGVLVTRVATLARRHDLRMVLVTERSDQTNLDYVVDGVVELGVDHGTVGRPERALVFEKLRGVRIANRTRPFTLSGETFRVFTPVDLPLSQRARNGGEWRRIDNTKAKFSTGISDLDAMLDGGYSRGSVVHFELGPDLWRDAWSLPCLATARNFLANGMGVAVVPLPESNPGLVQRNLEPVLTDVPFEARCEVFETYDHKRMIGTADAEDEEADDGDGPRTEGGARRFSYLDYLRHVESLREGSDGPLLHVIGMDAAGPELSDATSDHARYVALHNDLSILVTKPGSEKRARADRIADVHLRLERRGETAFLYGENPVTPFLGIDTVTSDDVSNVVLREMV